MERVLVVKGVVGRVAVVVMEYVGGVIESLVRGIKKLWWKGFNYGRGVGSDRSGGKWYYSAHINGALMVQSL